MKNTESNTDNINPNLIKYIQTFVFPIYDEPGVDNAHKLPHIQSVIDRSLNFAKNCNKPIDINMVYTIAAYHDTGLSIAPRSTHELASSIILKNDIELKRFFSKADIYVMVEAVKQHRASAKEEPCSIYGKIVSQADRDHDIDEIIKRSWEYNNSALEHDTKALVAEIRNHIIDKYGTNGYCRNKIWFSDTDLENFFNKVSELEKDRHVFDQYIQNQISCISE